VKYIHKDSLKWNSVSNVTNPDPFDEFEVLMIGIVKSTVCWVISPQKYEAPSTPHGDTTLKSMLFMDAVDFMNKTRTVILKSLVCNLHLFL
jgi:hypothetical protein